MRRATIFLVLTIVLLLSRVTHAKKQYTSQDTIRDKSIMLSGVTITRKLNPVKLSPDKISIRVSNKSRNTSGSVLDLLRKMPSVTILPNGSISLNGQEGVQILIDEKTNFLTAENLITFLASMPASSLETVELITQPNAVLDANGHGRFINLKRANTAQKDLALIISTNAEQGKYHRNHHHLNVVFTRNKFSLSNTYAFRRGSELVDVMSTRNITGLAGRTPLQIDMNAIRNKNYKNHYYNGILDYTASKTIKLSTYLLISDNKRSKDEIAGSLFFSDQSVADSTTEARNAMGQNFRNLGAGGQLIFHMQDHSKWESSFDRQYFQQSEWQDQMINKFTDERSAAALDTLNGTAQGEVRISTLQSKYTLDLGPDITAILGAKLTHVAMSTASFFHGFNGTDWKQRSDLNSEFEHHENLKALFSQVRYAASARMHLSFGLRYEDASFDSQTRNASDRNILNRSYRNIFPNLTMTYALRKKHQLSLNYNRRVNRPNFRDLSPAVEVNDPYLYERGNPELKPDFTNTIELGWLYQNLYSLHLFHSLIKDAISKSYHLDPYGRTVVQPMNIQYVSILGLRLNGTSMTPIKQWNIQLNANLIYKQFEWRAMAGNRRNRQLTPTLQIQNSVNLPGKMNLEINCFFNGPKAEGQATISPLWFINTGLHRKFLQDKLTLYIYTNDILQTNKPRIIFNGESMRGRYRELYDSRAVGVSVSYNIFNSKKVSKNAQSGDRLKENDRIIF
ncbi:TonB-dependent receptor domain-containing protein [Sphingobacterium thalpophilum]|uniref:Outer membrane cobalamin receptor protein n=1 Tax=Sphingobacterium thalpophilum TaxID=259 RepID=A0A4V6KWG0_9SPHI|nr:outer membrane beta-barrel family protein [Sphingobacterium thalpophilum]VTR50988.1 Outer membrane cobalamin receptor protein [Sphingobacterium thalpophilum]